MAVKTEAAVVCVALDVSRHVAFGNCRLSLFTMQSRVTVLADNPYTFIGFKKLLVLSKTISGRIFPLQHKTCEGASSIFSKPNHKRDYTHHSQS